MRLEDCFQLGTITRTHGKNGGLVLKLDTDRPEEYNRLESVLLEINQELVPFFIAEYQHLKAAEFFIAFEGMSISEARSLTGKPVYLPLTFLPKLSGKQFYFHEVIGFTVVDEAHGEIGTIKSVIERNPQHIFLVDHKGKEVLIPATDEFIVEINRSNKTITMACPDGLLDIYLTSTD